MTGGTGPTHPGPSGPSPSGPPQPSPPPRLATPTLTPAEEKQLGELLAELHDRGYRDITKHGRLHVGDRVRHWGHQWSHAFSEGTGFVVAMTERPDSAWSRTYRMPDIELIAVWDVPRPFDTSSRLSLLAQYHVCPVELAVFAHAP